MAREKKITIKHYLNERVRTSGYNPKFNLMYGDQKDYAKRHPVYTQVTYNRQSNNFSLSWYFNKGGGISPKEFNQYFVEKKGDREINNIIESKEKLIIDSIKYELEGYGDSFTLKGFGERLKKYECSIQSILKIWVYREVLESFEDKITVQDYRKIVEDINITGYLDYNFYDEGLLNSFHRIIDISPSLIINASKETRQTMSACTHFEHFLNYYSFQSKLYKVLMERDSYLINWLDGSLQIELSDFFSKKKDEKITSIKYQLSDFDYMNNYTKDIENLENMVKNYFPIEEFHVNHYLEIIDLAIIDFNSSLSKFKVNSWYNHLINGFEKN